jgi:nucleoid-associated protein YgaU
VTTPAPAAAPAPGPESVAAAPVPVRVVAGTSTGRASAGDRVHIVRPGESLWSIAADVLGERTTVARVAREVNRLWELNDDRIGSGNPDLLFAGTRLTLR